LDRCAYGDTEDVECVENGAAGELPTEEVWLSVDGSVAIYGSL